MAYDVQAIRADFPILSREVYGKKLVYLDNAASAQKPKPVLDAVMKAYTEEYANVHRGLHYLSNAATQAFEDARESVRRFINAMSGSVLIALLAPLAAQGDGGAKLALLVTAGVALVLKKPLPAISAGMIELTAVR